VARARKKKKHSRRSLVQAMAKAGSTELSPARIYRADEVVPSSILPSGYDNLDQALCIGGYPGGRLVTLYGPPACGKTTHALEEVVEAQQRGGVGVYFDFENKLEITYAEQLGVDMDFFIHDCPAYIEEAMQKTQEYLQVLREESPNAPVVFVWDSVTGAQSKMAYEGKWADHNFASESRVYSDKLRRYVRMISNYNALVIGIAQKRIKMDGGFSQNKIGPGNSWQHHNTVILSWFKKEKKKGNVKGDESEIWDVDVTKNQVGMPHRKFKLLMQYGRGHNRLYSTFQAALAKGVIEKSGTWYSVAGERLGQGKGAVMKSLHDDPLLLANVRTAVRADFSAKEIGSEGDDDEEK